MSLITYLMFNGNAEEAMNFYKDATGGNIEFIQRFGDTDMPTEEGDKNKVMHGIMDIKGVKLMFSDTDAKRKVAFGDNFSLSLDCKSDGELHRHFDAISTGGTVTMPPQDMFWGAKFGMCIDKFGVNWMFNYDKPKGD